MYGRTSALDRTSKLIDENENKMEIQNGKNVALVTVTRYTNRVL